MRDFQLRRLTCDVQNPCFDGRKANGFEAIRTIAKGTAFIYSPEIMGDEERSYTATIDLITDRPFAYSTDPKAVEVVLASSGLTTPYTYAELEASITGTTSYQFKQEVLDYLLSRGGGIMHQVIADAIKYAAEMDN